MSEPAIYGFKKENRYKVTYCHAESRLTLLGKDIINFIKNTSIKELNNIFDKIILVDEDEVVPKNLVIKYKKYSEDDCNWNCVLRDVQGHLEYYKEDLTHMVDNGDFLYEIEWIYIINLNSNQLEMYYNTQYMSNKNYNIFKTIFNLTNERKFENDKDCVLLKSISFENIEEEFNILLEKYNEYCNREDE